MGQIQREAIPHDHAPIWYSLHALLGEDAIYKAIYVYIRHFNPISWMGSSNCTHTAPTPLIGAATATTTIDAARGSVLPAKSVSVARQALLWQLQPPLPRPPPHFLCMQGGQRLEYGLAAHRPVSPESQSLLIHVPRRAPPPTATARYLPPPPSPAQLPWPPRLPMAHPAAA